MRTVFTRRFWRLCVGACAAAVTYGGGVGQVRRLAIGRRAVGSNIQTARVVLNVTFAADWCCVLAMHALSDVLTTRGNGLRLLLVLVGRLAFIVALLYKGIRRYATPSIFTLGLKSGKKTR